jgi:hypothetical protein
MSQTRNNKTRIAQMNVKSAQSVFMFTECRILDLTSDLNFDLPFL